MNHAWISGRAGCAVVVTPEGNYLLEAGGSQPPRPCSPGQLNNLRSLTSDLIQSASGPFPFQDVRQNLEVAWRSESALTMLRTTLDTEYSSSLRSQAADVAERLLADPEVHERVRWRLLGTPMPYEADNCCIAPRGKARELVEEAMRLRELVKWAGEVWDRLAFASPIGPERLAHFRQLFILYGGFSEHIASFLERKQAKPHAWLLRIPSGERDILDLASLDFLKRWSSGLEGDLGGLRYRAHRKDHKRHSVA